MATRYDGGMATTMDDVARAMDDVTRAERALTEARDARDRTIRAAMDDGLTSHAIARAVGRSQSLVMTWATGQRNRGGRQAAAKV